MHYCGMINSGLIDNNSSLGVIVILFKQPFSMNNKFWNAPAWSLGNKTTDKFGSKSGTLQAPGPGTYDVAGSVKKLGCRIGTSQRGANNRENVPGPGNYNISGRNNGPQISMGSKFIHDVFGSGSFAPGPGNYNTESRVRPGSGATMGAKYNHSIVQNQEPGPGSYDINGNPKGGVKIGTSKRANLDNKEAVPGPGQYTYEKRPYSAGPKYGFGRSGKGSAFADYAPGPGQYQVGSFMKSGQVYGRTMGQRFNKKTQTIDLAPGPGYYDAECKRSASGAKIGKAKRGHYDSGISPGPGAYDNNYRSFNGAKIGTSKRTDFGRAQTPGPGSYDYLQQSRGGVTISGHRGKSRMQNIPGPGAYNPDQFPHSRPCSANMGKSLRSDVNKPDVPGPGHYHPQESQSYKFAHTRELRSKEQKSEEPGPGQYEIPATVPSAPHYLIDPHVYKSGGSRA